MNPIPRQPIPRMQTVNLSEIESNSVQAWLAEIEEARRQQVIRHIRKQQFAHVFEQDVPQKRK